DPEASVHYWDWTLQPVRDGEGRTSGLVLNMLDVTARKQAQEALEAERQRLFSVLNMLPGYVALVNRDRTMRFANDRYLEFFGDPGDRPCYVVQRGRETPCPGCPALTVLDTGRPVNWEWMCPAGRTYHAWSYPFADVDGTEATLEVGIDVTERKMLEKQVIETSEKERRTIGRDLHDTLGQNLTGLAFLIKGLAGKMAERSPEEVRASEQIVDLVNSAISQVRSLARGLDPVGLAEGGLCAGLEELAADVERVFGISCRCECSRSYVPDDPSVATHLYHIAQEAVTNATRHARPKNIRITLAGDEEPALTVEDDGIGVDEQHPSGGKGMGMHIMRYRASVIGGSLTVSRRREGGTI
ncbi:hypothetical protein LCGC14_3041810, partial [marine sediment metagenome]